MLTSNISSDGLTDWSVDSGQRTGIHGQGSRTDGHCRLVQVDITKLPQISSRYHLISLATGSLYTTVCKSLVERRYYSRILMVLVVTRAPSASRRLVTQIRRPQHARHARNEASNKMPRCSQKPVWRSSSWYLLGSPRHKRGRSAVVAVFDGEPRRWRHCNPRNCPTRRRFNAGPFTWQSRVLIPRRIRQWRVPRPGHSPHWRKFIKRQMCIIMLRDQSN